MLDASIGVDDNRAAGCVFAVGFGGGGFGGGDDFDFGGGGDFDFGGGGDYDFGDFGGGGKRRLERKFLSDLITIKSSGEYTFDITAMKPDELTLTLEYTKLPKNT